MKKIYIPTCKGVKEISTGNIIRVEALSNYSKIYFARGYPLTVAKLLQWFEQTLPNDFFCRIHRTHLVNRQFIAAVSGNLELILQNGERLKISRRRKRQLHSPGLVGRN